MNRLRRLGALGLALGALLSTPSLARASSFPGLWDGWELVGEDDGIRVYKRTVRGTDLLDFGGEAVLEASVERLCSVLEDIPRYTEWVDSLATAEVLGRKDAFNYVYYQRYALPWPISDRDFVVRHELLPAPDGRGLIVRDHDGLHRRRPTDDCCIRGRTDLAEVRLQPLDGKRTAVAAMARVDMKGMLPVWLVNSIQEDFPRLTFAAYKKQLARADLVTVPACRDALAPAPSPAADPSTPPTRTGTTTASR